MVLDWRALSPGCPRQSVRATRSNAARRLHLSPAGSSEQSPGHAHTVDTVDPIKWTSIACMPSVQNALLSWKLTRMISEAPPWLIRLFFPASTAISMPDLTLPISLPVASLRLFNILAPSYAARFSPSRGLRCALKNSNRAPATKARPPRGE
jgi:hypothetical protein